MDAYSRGERIFEGGAYSIISPLEWALVGEWRLFEGGACSRHYGT